jgi:hypothetical protein
MNLAMPAIICHSRESEGLPSSCMRPHASLTRLVRYPDNAFTQVGSAVDPNPLTLTLDSSRFFMPGTGRKSARRRFTIS